MTTTEKSSGPTISERIAVGAAIAIVGSLIGTILCPGPGTAIGAKLAALLGSGSAS